MKRARSSVMVLFAAARDLSQYATPATKSQSGRSLKTTKHTADLLRRELRKNPHFSATELKKMHPDHLGNVSVRFIQHSLQKDLNIPSQPAASNPLLTPHMRNRCLQFDLRYLHGSVDDWKKVMSSVESTFQASPATNKGHLGAIIDP